MIFFGDFINIMNELPDFFLDYREKLAIDTRWSDRVCSGDGDWSGNVYDFYFRIVDRLTADVKKPFVINKNLLRDDDTDIHKSLREALANALIHADYYGRQGIVIEKDFRKMKFSNPGIFRISLDDAIAGGTSDARNSRIFNMFALIKVGERSGMGLCDIYNYWKEYGYEKPVIKETINPDRITLTLNIEYEANGGNVETNSLDTGKTSNQTTTQTIQTTTQTTQTANQTNNDNTEEQILLLIKNNPRLTQVQIAYELNVPTSTVKYDMPILYSCHPRSRNRLEKSGFVLDPRVIRNEPLGFHDYNKLQMNAYAVVSDSGTLPEESSFFTSVGHPFPAVCIRTSTERPEALDKACFILAGIDENSLLQAVTTAVDMNDNADYGIPVPTYVEENVSTKVVKIIQSYTGVVNKMVWRKN